MLAFRPSSGSRTDFGQIGFRVSDVKPMILGDNREAAILLGLFLAVTSY